MIDVYSTGRVAYVGFKVKKPVRVIESIGYEHEPECSFWRCKPCDCHPTKIILRGKRIIREVSRENRN